MCLTVYEGLGTGTMYSSLVSGFIFDHVGVAFQG